MELLAVGFALLLIATPIIVAVILFWRLHTVRQQLLKLTDLTMRLNDERHRELLDLKRKVEAMSVVAKPAETQAAAQAKQAVITPTVTAPVADESTPVVPSRAEKKPEFPAAATPQTPPAKPAEPVPTAPTSVKPAEPAKPAPAISAPPAVPITPPPLSPRRVVPAVTPNAIPSAPQQPAARVIPSPSPEFRAPAPAPSFQSVLSSAPPRPTAQQRMKSVFALEEILGTNWLNKLGIVLVVFGVALFGIYELGQVGPAGKFGLSLASSLALLGGGIFLERNDRYRVLGRTLIGGGWALLFFTTYAMNHVQAMRVMSSQTTDLTLMFAVAAAMVLHTLRYRSQVVTGLAFLLAYGTVALSNDDVYSLSSGVILAIGLVAIVTRMGWFELEVFGILSSYANHIYWLFRILGPSGAQGRSFPDYNASTAILFFYWITYRISYVIRKPKSSLQEHVSTAAALLNTLLLVGAMRFQSVDRELAFTALLVIGAVEFGCGQLPITRKRREAFVVLSVLGAGLMIVAPFFRYSGNNLAILWLIGAEVFLAAGVAVNEVVFRRIGLFTGLIVGAHLIAVDFQELLAARRINEDIALSAGMMFALCAVVFYLNVFLSRLRWGQFFDDPPESPMLWTHSYLGAFSAACAVWALSSRDWTAIAFAGIMLALAVLGRKLYSFHVQAQLGVIGLLALYRAAVVNLHSEVPQYTHVQNRLITLPILALVFYLTERCSSDGDNYDDDNKDQRSFRALFGFAGTALITALIYYEVPELWQPVAAIVFAVALLEVGRWITYPILVWHAHALSALAVLATLTTDPDGAKQWHNIPLHAFGALPVVAGLYWIAHRTRASDEIHARWAQALYKWTGSGLMAWVLFEAVPSPWITVAWALFAVVLVLFDRAYDDRDLRWQAHAVSALTMLRAVGINLYATEQWHGVSVRLLSLTVVAVIFYAMSRLIRMPEEMRRRDFHHIYSWAASALVSLLLWYELKPLSVAVGWAVFGLVLFEYGLWRKVGQFRFQSYVALAASFGRIFFANLTSSAPEEFWGPRLYTVLPIAVILFFVYSQLNPQEDAAKTDRLLRFDVLLAYLGTGSVAAFLYFQFPNEWLVTVWAGLVLALFAIADLLDRSIFLHQALLLTVGTFARGLMHNLFGASYFTAGDWTGRFFVLGSAIAILLGCLPFAFSWREKHKSQPGTSWIAAIVRRPEQFMFFAPVALLTMMLALKMRAGMVTVSWGVESLAILIFAFLINERSFRLTGLALLLISFGKIIAVDLWGLQIRDRYITLIIVGAVMSLASFLYAKYSDRIKQFL